MWLEPGEVGLHLQGLTDGARSRSLGTDVKDLNAGNNDQV